MLLTKQIAVDLDISACKYRHYTATMLRKYGVDVTPEQLLLLDSLWNLGAMNQNKLATILQKDKNCITKLVDGLVRKGYIVREADQKDRRANTIVLTRKGIEAKDDAKEKGIAILETVTRGISDRELTSFLDTLAKMQKNMIRHERSLK